MKLNLKRKEHMEHDINNGGPLFERSDDHLRPSLY